MISGMPSHQAIMRQDEGPLSNLKREKLKGGVFMTPILSHQVGYFRQGGIVLPRMWEEKGPCVLSLEEKSGRISSWFPLVVVLRA